MEMMKEHTFYIVYDGPVLAGSEMDVRQLAPALHAVGDLLEAASRVVHGKTFKTQVKVKGSFKTGCFGVDLVCCQRLLDSLVGLFTSDYFDAALNLVETVGLVGGSGGGLVWFVRKLRNRPIKRVVELGDNKVRVEVDDEHIEIERTIIELYKDIEVRKALDAVIKVPLETAGIESFGSGQDNKSVAVIRKSEAAYFTAPDLADELISETEYDTVVKVVTVAFQEDNMWRLSEGQNVFYARIEDDKFIKDVQSNEKSFTKDDLFFVTLRKKQFLGDNGNVKTEYSIFKVNNHRSAMRQISLPLEPPVV